MYNNNNCRSPTHLQTVVSDRYLSDILESVLPIDCIVIIAGGLRYTYTYCILLGI